VHIPPGFGTVFPYFFMRDAAAFAGFVLVAVMVPSWRRNPEFFVGSMLMEPGVRIFDISGRPKGWLLIGGAGCLANLYPRGC